MMPTINMPSPNSAALYRQIPDYPRNVPQGTGSAAGLDEIKREADYERLSYRREIQGVLGKIDQAREENINSDGEEDEPVSYETAKRARQLVLDSALRVEDQNISWFPPAVSPTPEGGVYLFWRRGEQWVAITELPENKTLCITKTADGRTQRIEVSDWGAINRLLDLLKDGSRSSHNG